MKTLAFLTFLAATLAPSLALPQTPRGLDGARAALAAPHEPTERQTRAAALRHARLAGPLDTWSDRARLANLVPTLELRATATRRHDAQTEYREDQVRDANGDFFVDDARQDVDRLWREGDGLVLRARLDLGRAIFDPAELQAARVTDQLRQRRAALGARVAELYWRRRGHLARLRLTDPDDLERRVELLALISRDTASLDALTGDWFSRSCEAPR
jgi:hypothetical protein